MIHVLHQRGEIAGGLAFRARGIHQAIERRLLIVFVGFVARIEIGRLDYVGEDL